MQNRAPHIVDDADYKLALLHLIYAWLACSSAWWLFTSVYLPEATLVRSVSIFSMFLAATLFAIAQYGSQRFAGLSFIAIMFSASCAAIWVQGFHTLMPGLIYPTLLATFLLYNRGNTKRVVTVFLGLFFTLLFLHSLQSTLAPKPSTTVLVPNSLLYVSINSFTFAYIAISTAIIGWHLSKQAHKTLIEEEDTLGHIQQEVADQQNSLKNIYRHLERDVLVLDAQQHIVCITAQLLAKLRLREDEILNTPAANWFTDEQGHAPEFSSRSSGIRFKPNPLLRDILWRPLKPESQETYHTTLIELSFSANNLDKSHEPTVFELDPSLGLALFQKQIERATQTLQAVEFILCRLDGANALIIENGVNHVRSLVRDACLSLYQTLGCQTALVDSHTIVLMPATGASRTSHRAHHYLNALKSNVNAPDNNWVVTPITAPIDGGNVNDLLATHRACDSEHTTRSLRQRVLAHIRAKDFVVHFQAIANLNDTSEILFFEALARWVGKDPMPPPEFLKHAFAMGLGNHMTLLLFDVFCKALEQHLRQKPNSTSKFSFNIHLSTFVDLTMRKALTDIVNQSSVRPTSIIFELLEIEDATNLEEIYEAMRYYKGLGFSFAIDDFGHSFSSIQRLSLLKIDYLKLDASITHALCDTNIQVVIRNLAKLASEWQMPLIAEGIETKAQKAELQELGIHWGQGYLISRPAPLQIKKRGSAL